MVLSFRASRKYPQSTNPWNNREPPVLQDSVVGHICVI